MIDYTNHLTDREQMYLQHYLKQGKTVHIVRDFGNRLMVTLPMKESKPAWRLCLIYKVLFIVKPKQGTL